MKEEQKTVPVQLRVHPKQRKQWQTLADDLFNQGHLQKGSVKCLISEAVDEYAVNVSHYSPSIRSRLVKFALKCCGGRVNQAIEVMLNRVDV
jgi:hypothetical protein